MTPDAVIYRYLQLITPSSLDTERLCELLSADADLLTRWLRVLNIPADRRELSDRLSQMAPEEFQSVSGAQAWSVLPNAGSARLSFDQWQSVLKAACVAEVLYGHVAAEADAAAATNTANVRLRALLALSGVQLSQDVRLAQLIEFRGTNPVLLEDASLELRVFAVVDAIDMGRDVELGQQLLGVAPSDYADLLQQAESHAAGIIDSLGVQHDTDTDWAHKIWLRQQITVIGSGFRNARTLADLALTHLQVSRCLFAKAPLLLLLNAQSGRYELFSGDGLSINPGSLTSRVAAAARTGVPQMVAEAADLAVVDRQLLRLLHCEEAYVAATGAGDRRAILLVDGDEDLDVESATDLYAEEFGRYLTSFEAPDSAAVSDLVEQFRQQESRRLREIVHEANNPLSIVHNYLHILELRLQHEPEAIEQLELIASELRRAGDIFSRAREVPSGTEAPAPEGATADFDLADWLRDVVELHQGLAGQNGVRLELYTAQDQIGVHTDQNRLNQVVTNLVKNALEACAPDDQVTVTAEAPVYRQGQVGVEITVADSGPGLPAQVLENLTGQKQSDKPGHQGVGLQIAYRLADQLNAALDLRTTASGTRFSLFLPAMDAD